MASNVNLQKGDVPSAWDTYSIFGLTLASDVPFASRLAPGTKAPKLTFTCVTQPLDCFCSKNMPPAYASRYQIEDGQSVLYVYHCGDCNILSFTQIADFYLWPDRIICHLLDPQYKYLVEIRLLGTVLSFWLERAGFPSLHAAAVSVKQGAVAFLGINGGGKSSLAAALMQAGYPLLTDDILPVYVNGKEIYGHPGYPQLRMWPDQADYFLGYHESLALVHPSYSKRRAPVGDGGFGEFCNESRPLSCIYIPERYQANDGSADVAITAVTPKGAVIELVRNSFSAQLVEAAGMQTNRLEKFARLTQTVPVRRIRYPSGFENLASVRRVILDDLETIKSRPDYQIT